MVSALDRLNYVVEYGELPPLYNEKTDTAKPATAPTKPVAPPSKGTSALDQLNYYSSTDSGQRLLPQRGFVSSVVSGLGRGVAQTGKLAAGVLQMSDLNKDEDTTPVSRFGATVRRNMEHLLATSDFLRPDVGDILETKPRITKDIQSSAESLMPSLAVIVPTAVASTVGSPIAGTIVGGASLGLLFGVGGYQDTYLDTLDYYKEQGIPITEEIKNKASTHALISATADVAFEGVSDFATMGIMGVFGRSMLKQPLKSTIKQISRGGGLKAFSLELGASTLAQAGGEVGSALVETASAKYHGLPSQDPLEASYDAAMSSVYLSLFLSLGLKGVSVMNANKILRMINSSNPVEREAAKKAISNNIEKEHRTEWESLVDSYIAANQEIPLSTPVMNITYAKAQQEHAQDTAKKIIDSNKDLTDEAVVGAIITHAQKRLNELEDMLEGNALRINVLGKEVVIGQEKKELSPDEQEELEFLRENIDNPQALMERYGAKTGNFDNVQEAETWKNAFAQATDVETKADILESVAAAEDATPEDMKMALYHLNLIADRLGQRAAQIAYMIAKNNATTPELEHMALDVLEKYRNANVSQEEVLSGAQPEQTGIDQAEVGQTGADQINLGAEEQKKGAPRQPKPKIESLYKKSAIQRKDERVERPFYRPYEVRDTGLVEDVVLADEQFFADGFYSNGRYAVAAYEEGETIPNNELTGAIIKRLPNDQGSPAKIVGEFVQQDRSVKTPVMVHVKADDGTQSAFNASYVDSILTGYPNAEPFLHKNGTLVFKVGDRVVGLVFKDRLAPFALKGIGKIKHTSPVETLEERANRIRKELKVEKKKEKKGKKTAEKESGKKEELKKKKTEKKTEPEEKSKPAKGKEKSKPTEEGKKNEPKPKKSAPKKPSKKSDEDIKFTKRQPALTKKRKITKAIVSDIVNKMMSVLGRKPNVVVVDDFKELFGRDKSPESDEQAIYNAMKEQGLLDKNGNNADVQGFLFRGKVYMIASNMGSYEDVAKVFLHELTHKGLAGFFSTSKSNILKSVRLKYDSLMDSIYKSHKSEIDELVATRHSEHDIGTVEGRRAAAEEWLCNQTYDAVPKWYDKYIALVRDILRYLKIDKIVESVGGKFNISDAEIRTVLQDAFNEYKLDTDKARVLYSRRGFSEKFYSKLITTVENKLNEMPRKKQSVEKWLERQGVMPAEMRWMGVKTWVEENEKDGLIDRDAFFKFLKSNEIVLEEDISMTISDLGRNPKLKKEWDNLWDRHREIVKKRYENIVHLRKAYNLGETEMLIGRYTFVKHKMAAEVRLKIPDLPNELVDKTVNLQLQLDNIDDEIHDFKREHIEDTARYDYIKFAGGSNYRELLIRLPADGSVFRSTHWDQPNVLVHIRFDERIDDNGRRILFIEEIQSDWHQEGKEKGYGIKEKLPDGWSVKETGMGGARQYEVFDENGRLLAYSRNRQAAIHKATPNYTSSIPYAPFAENWHGLAMKRMIRYAAENGFDKVAWTTGEHQARRYGDGARNKGKGLKVFYDERLTKSTNKYIKQWGSKIKFVKILTDVGKNIYKIVHSFDITEPMMRDVLYKGQPLYTRRATDKASKTIPAHGTTLDKLDSILSNGLNAGSALDITVTRDWASESEVIVEVPDAMTGEYVKHNNYYKSANKSVPTKVIIDLDVFDDRGTEIAKEQIVELKKKYPDVEFEILNDIPPSPEALTIANLKKFFMDEYGLSERDAEKSAKFEFEVGFEKGVNSISKFRQYLLDIEELGYNTMYENLLSTGKVFDETERPARIKTDIEKEIERLYADRKINSVKDLIDAYKKHDASREEQIKYTRKETTETPEQIDKKYFDAVKRGDDKTVKQIIDDLAASKAADTFSPDEADNPVFRIRRKPAPKDTIKVYKKASTLEGNFITLFVGGSSPVRIPIGVWLDAKEGFKLLDKTNGKYYVPVREKQIIVDGKLQTPKMGNRDVVVSDTMARKFESMGYKVSTKKSTGEKYVKCLAYRPGWHMGQFPIFGQGGKQMLGTRKTANYPNDVYYEVEIPNPATSEWGKIAAQDPDGDVKELPIDGSYIKKTQGDKDSVLGDWYIAGTMKVIRPLTEAQVAEILSKNGIEPQGWADYQDSSKFGELDLEQLGVNIRATDAFRKLSDPITYDDDGNIIPPSQRFNIGKDDIRFTRKEAEKLPFKEHIKYVDNAVIELEADYHTLLKDPEANRDKISRIVETVADLAGYTRRGYHGTVKRGKGGKPFTVFDLKGRTQFDNGIRIPIFFATEKSFAENYPVDAAEHKLKKEKGALKFMPTSKRQAIKNKTHVYDVFLNVGNMFDLTDKHIKELRDANLITKEEARELRDGDDTWRILEKKSVQQYLFDMGYDSFITYEGGVENIAVFDPRRIKLADNVTTDKGNTIPLMSRFNYTDDDIRFTRKDAADLKETPESIEEAAEKRLKELRATVEKFKGFSVGEASLKREYMDRDAKELGIKIYKRTPKTHEEEFGKARQDIESKKVNAEMVVNNILEQGRRANESELPVVLLHAQDLKNQIEATAAEIREARKIGNIGAVGYEDKLISDLMGLQIKFEKCYNVATQTTSEHGYGLQLARVNTLKDFSLAAMIREMTNVVGKENMNAELVKKIIGLQEQIAAKQREIDEIRSKELEGVVKGIVDAGLVLDPDEADRINTGLGKKARKAVRGEGSLKDNITEMFRNKVMAGMRDPQEIVKAISIDLNNINISLTDSEIMKEISNYGNAISQTREGVEGEISKLRSIYRLMLALEDVKRGKRPEKTGFQRATPSEEERKLLKEIRERLKRLGLNTEVGQARWKTALEAVKTRLRNEIADLERQRDTGEKPLEKGKIIYDEEAKALKEIRDTLKSVVNELEGNKRMSEQRKLKLAEHAVEAMIKEYEKRIKEQDFSPLNKSPKITSEQLEQRRKVRDRLKSVYTEMKKANTEATMTDEQMIALQMRRIGKRIEYYIKLMEKGIYRKPESRKLPYSKDHIRAQMVLHETIKEFHEFALREGRKHRTRLQAVKDTLLEAQDISRAIRTAYDISYLRQALFAAAAHPTVFFRSVPVALKAMRSPRGEFEVMELIRSFEHAHLYGKINLDITEARPLDKTRAEEQYQSRHAEKIWGVGASARGYRAPLSYIRATLFEREMARLKAKGITPALEDMKYIARDINIFTGRGAVSAKQSVIIGANSFLFAARLLLSRIQLASGLSLRKGTKISKQVAAERYLRSMICLGGLYAAAVILGGDTDPVPISSDFGKFKIGRLRVDPLGGMGQVVMFFSRLISRRTIGKEKKVKPIAGKDLAFGTNDWKQIVFRFCRSKLSPVVGVAVDIYDTKTYVGKPTTPLTALEGLLAPMSMMDIYEAYTELDIPEATVLSILAAFGLNIMVYD